MTLRPRPLLHALQSQSQAFGRLEVAGAAGALVWLVVVGAYAYSTAGGGRHGGSQAGAAGGGRGAAASTGDAATHALVNHTHGLLLHSGGAGQRTRVAAGERGTQRERARAAAVLPVQRRAPGLAAASQPANADEKR